MILARGQKIGENRLRCTGTGCQDKQDDLKRTVFEEGRTETNGLFESKEKPSNMMMMGQESQKRSDELKWSKKCWREREIKKE